MHFYAPLLKPLYMHIPDGFLSLPVALFFWGVAILLILLAVRHTRGELDERQIPLMGVMAAFIFAAQMINFPVAGGTSGHLLGGVLAAIILGPWAGMLVMTSVIGVQALLFQDGGLLVMGANIFNMGLLTALIGYGLYRAVASRDKPLRLAAAGFAAWLSVVTGALFTSLQIWLSGSALLTVILPAMLSVHILIGIGEALITVAALAFILQTRPDLISAKQSQEQGRRGWIVVGILTSLAVLLLAPIASSNPDGLERVAIDLGFFQRGTEAPFSIFSNYTVPGLGNTSLSTLLAGATGALIAAGVAVLVVRSLRHPSKT
jgi:cobalt/nickel transport system permease protein